MPEKINKKRCSFISSYDSQTINACLFVPNECKAYIQIFIDITQNMDSYDELATFLCKLGFLVGIVDLRKIDGNKLYFSNKDGLNRILNDQITLFDKITNENNLKGLTFGDGFGSYLQLYFLKRYSKKVYGAIISGLPVFINRFQINKNILELTYTNKKGKEESSLFKRLLNYYIKKLKNPKTNYDWLSYNENNIIEYLSNKVVISNKAYEDILECAIDVNYNDWFTKDRKLPLLICAGKDDPLVNYPKGFNYLIERLSNRGFEKITVNVYENMRHQVFKESNKIIVYEDLVKWINEQLRRIKNLK